MQAPFPKGRFWQQVMRRAMRARVRGALHAIATEQVTAQDRGLGFLIRIAQNLASKALKSGDGSDSGAGTNPFLPYDPDLFVCDVSSSHLCLLNKFNVVDHHLLLVTRQFEPQEQMLTFADFEAWWTCLAEFDGLGFFNCGPASGASQPHRHLQLVPLPLADRGPSYPFESLFTACSGTEIDRLPGLPFRHAVVSLPYVPEYTLEMRAERAQAAYGLLLDAVGLAPIHQDQVVCASASYNLLLTRDWMMIVPRSQERFGTVSLNALAFVGSIFVSNREGFEAVLAHGPLSVLTEVGMPA